MFDITTAFNNILINNKTRVLSSGTDSALRVRKAEGQYQIVLLSLEISCKTDEVSGLSLILT